MILQIIISIVIFQLVMWSIFGIGVFFSGGLKRENSFYDGHKGNPNQKA